MIGYTCYLQHSLKLLILFFGFFICLSSNLIYGQKINSPECYPSPPPDLEDSFLCDKIGDLSFDIVIGPTPGNPGPLTNFASAIPLPTYIQNMNILINGTLIIDQYLAFFNSNIVLKSGAKIIVLSDIGLGGYLSRFYSCECLWDGIEFQSNSLGSFWSCTFEDAQHVISADDDVTLYLNDNTFNRNHIGIINLNASGGFGGMNVPIFWNNTFTSSSALRCPREAEYGYCGLYFDKCVASFGSYYSTNYFNKMEYGIVAYSSSITIQKCRIGEMRNNLYSCGIKLMDGSANIIGYNETISDCQVSGIDAAGTNLSIKDYNFGGNQIFGISSGNNLAAEFVRITNNNVTLDDPNNLAGIALDRSIASRDRHNYILSNKITINEPVPIGIYVSGSNPAIDNMIVQDNLLYINEVGILKGISIHALNGRGFQVLDNVIRLQTTDWTELMYGIHFYNSLETGHEISHNTVRGLEDLKQAQCAIHIDYTSDVAICDNIVSNTMRGFHFPNSNDPAHFRNNKMYYHERGIYIHDGNVSMGTIGKQVRRGNTWLPWDEAYSLWAAHCESLPDRSQFITESSDPSILPPLRFPGGNDWFIPEAGETDYCEGEGTEQDYPVGETEKTIVEGGIEDLTESQMQQWELTRRLYFKLLQHPELVEASSPEEAFLATYADSSAGLFAIFQVALFNALLPDTTLQSALDQNASDQFVLLEQLAVLDSTIQPPFATLTADTTLEQSKKVILDDLKILANVADSLKSLVKEQQSYNIQTLDSLNSTLPENKLWEQNMKRLNVLILGNFQGDTLTVEDESILRDIAYQCLGEGGSAVWLARSMLPYCEQYPLTSDDPEPCEEFPRIGHQHSHPLNSSNDFIISPNPANEELRIMLPEDILHDVYIFNLSGHLLQSISVGEKNSMVLDIRTFSDGMYIIRAVDKEGKVRAKKFLVLK